MLSPSDTPHKKLVVMANQIADFFRYQGDDESTKEENVAAHLRHFWAPPMRRDLVAHLDDYHGEGMQPLVRAAVARFRDKLLGQGTHVPGEKRLEEPRGGGDAG